MSRNTFILALVFGALIYCSFFGTVGEVPRSSYDALVLDDEVLERSTSLCSRWETCPVEVSSIDGGTLSRFSNEEVMEHPQSVLSYWIRGTCLADLPFFSRCVADVNDPLDLEQEIPTPLVAAGRHFLRGFQSLRLPEEEEGALLEDHLRPGHEDLQETVPRNLLVMLAMSATFFVVLEKIFSLVPDVFGLCDRRRLQDTEICEELKRENARCRIEDSSERETPRRRIVVTMKEYVEARKLQRLIPAEGMRPWLKGVECIHCLQGRVISQERLIMWRTDSGPIYEIPCFPQGTRGEFKEPLNFLVDTGCSYSVIYYQEVKKLGLLDEVDTNKFFRFNAMGGKKGRSYGTLKVSLKTASGVTILRQLGVLKLKGTGGVLGLDVLVSQNCSLILDTAAPRIQIREACGSLPKRRRLSYTMKAKLNGTAYACLLDTGSTYCFVPKDFGVPMKRIWSCLCLEGATKWPILVRKKVPGLRVEFAGCVHFVDALVMNEPFPVVGTDVLQGKRIDFVHGLPYVTSIEG